MTAPCASTARPSRSARNARSRPISAPPRIFAPRCTAWRIERHGTRGRTVTLKLRHADFRTITRARSSQAAVTDKAAFLAAGLDLLMAQLPVPDGVRLLGLTLSGIMGDEDEVQPSLL
jgi:DNA polymerase-4